MKVTLQVNGREMTFSEEELIAILEKHFSREKTVEETKKETKEETEIKNTSVDVLKKPTEGELFLIRPKTIKRHLFVQPRENQKQETIRLLILEAFVELENNTQYTRAFETMTPVKTWDKHTEEEHIAYAEKEGDHITNWVEQSLQWAQRISDGEPWENICDLMDTANWYRVVMWKDGELVLVGGIRTSTNFLSASSISKCPKNSIYITDYAVPLITRYIESTVI